MARAPAYALTELILATLLCVVVLPFAVLSISWIGRLAVQSFYRGDEVMLTLDLVLLALSLSLAIATLIHFVRTLLNVMR